MFVGSLPFTVERAEALRALGLDEALDAAREVPDAHGLPMVLLPVREAEELERVVSNRHVQARG